MNAVVGTYPLGWRQIVRNAQTFLPSGLQEARLEAQQWTNRILRRPHEREFAALRGRLPAGAHVIDVGANRGQSIDSLRTLGVPGLRITAFEPQRDLAFRLMQRYPGVAVHSVGIGAANAGHTLYTPSYRGYRFDGLASCSREEAVAWFPYSVWPYRPDLVTVDEERVHVRRLDSFSFDRIDFVKFDVQGMELAALEGAAVLLDRFKPLLMLEFPSNEVVSWLTGHGYIQYQVNDGGRLVTPTGRWDSNHIFRHRQDSPPEDADR